jgi:CRISPR-associated protein Csb1
MNSINLDALTKAVGGDAAAIRTITRLEPAGGAGDKIFPPTYVKAGRAETKYAMENRHLDGREVRTVLLDSVASQANRFEEALAEGWRRGTLLMPIVQVDFTGEPGLEDLEQITTLHAPHRIASPTRQCPWRNPFSPDADWKGNRRRTVGQLAVA